MTEIDQPNRVVGFTRMDESTKEDIALIFTESKKFLNDRLVDTMVDLLDSLKGPTLGYQVDRYEHSLQTASRAYREGARTDLIVAALLHDVGDAMAPANHAELAASIVRPYLDAESTWVVQHHGIFQGYHYWDRLGLDTDAREKIPRFTVFRHLRPLLCRVGPGVLRPRLRDLADRSLRADVA